MRTTHVVVISAWISRLVVAASMIYSLRILSGSLSDHEYATFIIVMGLAGWYALADLGVSFATQNSVTRLSATQTDFGPVILSAYMILGGVTLLMGLLIFSVSDVASRFLFAKVQEDLAGSHGRVFWMAAIILTITATAGTSSKILYGLHKGYIANIATAICSIIGLTVLSAGLPMAADKVPFAVTALYGPNALFALGLALHQIYKARGSRSRITKATFADLAHSARGFFLFNVLAAAVLQIDYIIMSQRVEPREMIQYYTLAKLFTFVAFFNQAIMFAAWPTFTDSFTKGSYAVISASIRKLVALGALIAIVSTFGVIVFSGPLGSYLSPDSPIPFRNSVIIAFGAVALARAFVDPFAIFLQSIGSLRPLIIFAASQAVVSVVLQWTLSKPLGIEGILIALIASFLLTVSWGLPLSASRRLRGR
jgi:O-antigen/teichoic acid export membrane protein